LGAGRFLGGYPEPSTPSDRRDWVMRCQRCGTSSPIGNRFCGNCGAPLTATDVAGRVGTAAGPVAVPAQLASELRWVSVLFVDLVDYTALTHSWDAGDIRDMLAAYFELARGIVGRYGARSRSSSAMRWSRSGIADDPRGRRRTQRSRRSRCGGSGCRFRDPSWVV
jgi:hypothetical protein